MTRTIISRKAVAEQFAVTPRLLVRYEARGLISPVHEGELEGYRPSDLRRIWTILSLQRDLGINLAGVEAILKLRSHVDDLHERLTLLAEELRAAIEAAEEETDE